MSPLQRGTLAVAVALTMTIATGAVAADEKAADTNPVATIKTSMGDITVELFADKAPISTKNFVDYAKSGYYEGTIFHRVIGNFMIQGGGMDTELKPKPGQKGPIKNEADNGLKNEKGTLAMARTSAPDSATSQFFINVKDNDFLNHRNKSAQGYGYAVFGKVIGGQDVVEQIKEVPTGNKDMYQDVPNDPITIESVTIKE